METFFEMLTYRRPDGSDTEERFIEKFLMPLDVGRDMVGNLYKQIGEPNGVLWSSHTDTVHRIEGMQSISVGTKYVTLPENTNSNCLGADCTTGVFIMTEMMKAKVPGLYVFHRGEECGGIGSRHIAKDKKLLEGIRMAIAFDRYGTTSIITHQFGRCASEKFAESVAKQIPYLKADAGGVFTDTANYVDIVPECTNFSVGYLHHHTEREQQDLVYLAKFIEDMKKLDTSLLSVVRDPTVSDFGLGYSWMNDDFHTYGGISGEYSDPSTSVNSLIKNNPTAVASLLRLYGVSKDELMEHIFAFNQTSF